MAAAVWTACTKSWFFAKKSLAPGRPGALLFYGVFEGVWGKVGGFGVVFCGGLLVKMWWGWWWFLGAKNFPLF
jgi:hypothetical protein